MFRYFGIAELAIVVSDVERSKKFYAHDEKGLAKTGQRVRIVETAPTSKLKRWRVIEVLS